MNPTEIRATGDWTDHLGIGGVYFETARLDSTVLSQLPALLSQDRLYDLFVWQSQRGNLIIGALKQPVALERFNLAKAALCQKLPPQEASTLHDIRWANPDAPGRREQILEGPPLPAAELDWFWRMNDRLPRADYGDAPKIKIGHIDTGLTVHPCLVGGYTDGKSFIDETQSGMIYWSGTPLPFMDHGTATAGLIMGASSASDSRLVLKGMALPQKEAMKRLPIVVVPCRVGDSPILTVEVKRAARAINWAVENDCKVISISMGCPIYDGDLETAVRNAHDHGVIVCAAAGQDYPGIIWPGAFAREKYGKLCISCGPSTPERLPWWRSDWLLWPSDYVTIAAPGTEMPKPDWERSAPPTYTPNPPGAIVISSEGSSYSTAYVASAAALWYCKNFRLLQDVPKNKIVGLFRNLLVETCNPWAPDPLRMGRSYPPGIANATRLLRSPMENISAKGLSAITATVHSGKRIQLWGITAQGTLTTSYQETANGNWTRWRDFPPAKPPRNLVALTAANQGDDRCALWAVDRNGSCYCTYQDDRGNWQPWVENWTGAPPLKTVCAVLEGGGRGVRLWAIDAHGYLRCISQRLLGSDWGKWNNESPSLYFRGIALSAMRHPDGRSVIWVLNDKHELSGSYEQTTAHDSWSEWKSPWNGAGLLSAICTAVHSGGLAQIWGVDLQGKLTTCYQEKVGGGWTSWRAFRADSPTDVVKITAASHGDGRCLIWAVRRDGTISYAEQQSAGGDWLPWNQWIAGV